MSGEMPQDNNATGTKKQARRGIVSLILGVVSLSVAIYFLRNILDTFDSAHPLVIVVGGLFNCGGELLAIAASISGLTLGVSSFRKQEGSRVIPVLGVMLNAAALVPPIVALIYGLIQML